VFDGRKRKDELLQERVDGRGVYREFERLEDFELGFCLSIKQITRGKKTPGRKTSALNGTNNVHGVVWGGRKRKRAQRGSSLRRRWPRASMRSRWHRAGSWVEEDRARICRRVEDRREQLVEFED
jgi:hypothetical protein